MAKGCSNTILPHIQRAFQAGSISGLSDGELLERFSTRNDELAFEALVARHGPMVLRVCRNLLREESNVEDAFQATFLVLVRKAKAICLKDTLGPWLYAVATRVAQRSRAKDSQRQQRERAGSALEASAPTRDADLHELPAILQRELARLPEHFRAPIVLFHLEGLSHDQTAAQLRWPVGTVRSRLARARGLLRERLIRRGFTFSATALGLALGRQTATAAVPRKLSLITIEAATRLSMKQGVAAGIASASVVSLTEGVLYTMFLSKVKVAATVLIAVGALVGGVAVRGGEDPKGEKARPSTTETKTKVSSVIRATLSEEIESKLNVPVSLMVEDRPLSEAVSSLTDSTGLEIAFDSKALRDLDLTTSFPVTLQVSGVKLKSALKLLLKPMGLQYKVDGEVLMITSLQRRLDPSYAHTYYVGDLISPFGNKNESGRAARVDFGPVIELITTTVEPGTWNVVDVNTNDDKTALSSIPPKSNNPQGTITPFFLSISLIIRHTPETHEKIATLLQQVRHLQNHRNGQLQSHAPGTPCPAAGNAGDSPTDSKAGATTIAREAPFNRNFEPVVTTVSVSPTGRLLIDRKYERIESLLKEMGQRFTEVNRELEQLKRERKVQ